MTRDQIIILVLGIFLILNLMGSGIGFKAFKDHEKILQKTIDENIVQIEILEVEKEIAISNALLHSDTIKMLGDSLKMSYQNNKEIKKYYEKRIIHINSATDSEYIEYLRSRLSDPN